MESADDVRIDNNPDHAPGCGSASRRAFRAAAIPASISSMVLFQNLQSISLGGDAHRRGLGFQGRPAARLRSGDRDRRRAVADAGADLLLPLQFVG